jgi:hypothetical protein
MPSPAKLHIAMYVNAAGVWPSKTWPALATVPGWRGVAYALQRAPSEVRPNGESCDGVKGAKRMHERGCNMVTLAGVARFVSELLLGQTSGKPLNSLDRGLGEGFPEWATGPPQEQEFEHQMTPLRGKSSAIPKRFFESFSEVKAPVGESGLRTPTSPAERKKGPMVFWKKITSMTITTAEVHAELVVIRARMQAIESTLKPGQCPIEATDPIYARQEALRALLLDLDGAE